MDKEMMQVEQGVDYITARRKKKCPPISLHGPLSNRGSKSCRISTKLHMWFLSSTIVTGCVGTRGLWVTVHTHEYFIF